MKRKDELEILIKHKNDEVMQRFTSPQPIRVGESISAKYRTSIKKVEKAISELTPLLDEYDSLPNE